MDPNLAKTVAAGHLKASGARWAHVQAVGRLADSLVEAGLVSQDVATAAWLHDVGYATALVDTGFHPLDGARSVEGVAARNVVALIAHHTGADVEAQERGLTEELARMPVPDPEDLDVLTLLDLVVGPDGSVVTPEWRVNEVLHRYEPHDPVNRAMTRSRDELLAAAGRARGRLGLPDEWPRVAAEGVLEPQSH